MSVNDVVMQSYGRCCASTSFFDDFYQTFLASSAEIRDKFQNTDMPAQKQLLRQGILNLVLYARGLPPTKLKALAESHSRHRLNIEPHLYELWLDALLKTIDAHDRDSDRTVLRAWEQVLSKGIEVIKTGY
ncbi:globin [Halopseudomonas phragmitis]|uniref:Globin n=2 Tax=Pseudomonadaceae TaxID=135621 RepID=A0A1V0B822_9GAMM|nr:MULTISPECIES: globin [Pseudomonadaceae]AQZ96088.1 globin [Halopseudomonas phragmitis]RHW20925.1 globin [Pseudomonas jilinensis]